MIKINFLLISLILCIHSYGQKYDNTWILGSYYTPGAGDTDSCFYGIELNFNKTLTINRRVSDITMRAHNNSFCDEGGDLLLYTNGCYLKDKFNNIIDGGDTLNPFWDYNWFCSGPNTLDGIPHPNASLFLPLNNGDIFYLSLETKTNPNIKPNVYSPSVLVTLIENKAGQLKVKYKNKNILSGNHIINRTGLVACKNRDNESWWVVCRNLLDSSFFIFQINQDTVLVKEQKIGNKYISGNISQSIFSPDGKVYAMYSQRNGLEIMDFNGEDGTFSNYKKIQVVDTTGQGYSGVSVSPNSQFLYVATQYDLYQYDLFAPDIASSVVLIHQVNGTISQCSDNGQKIPLFYYQMQLGPDCRIYMTSVSAALYLSVILYPDRKGKACQFIEGGVKLPSYNYSSIPQFPHYRGNEAYPCDSTIRFVTSNINFDEWTTSISVYPNPAYGDISISFLGELPNKAKLELVNIFGMTVVSKLLEQGIQKTEFDVLNFPSGIYLIKLSDKRGVIGLEKMMVE